MGAARHGPAVDRPTALVGTMLDTEATTLRMAEMARLVIKRAVKLLPIGPLAPLMVLGGLGGLAVLARRSAALAFAVASMAAVTLTAVILGNGNRPYGVGRYLLPWRLAIAIGLASLALLPGRRARAAATAIVALACLAARATTILIIALYLGYAVLDFRAGTVGVVWPLRLVVVAILGVNLALTWRPVFERAHSEILDFGGLAGALGILAMMVTVGSRMEVAFYPGIGMAIIGTFTLFRIRFPIALADALLMVAPYSAVLATGDHPYESAFMGASIS